MTTTIATQSASIAVRLKVTAGSGNEPSDANIQTACRDAFKDAISALPPITLTSGTLSSRSLTLTADRVFFVTSQQNGILIEGVEWVRSTTGIKVLPMRLNGDVVTAWIFTSLVANGTTAIGAASTTVDTSCIFGTDWLEELATIGAEMTICKRLMNVAPSQSGSDFGAMYRTLSTETYPQLFARKQAIWSQWYQEKQQALNDRRMFGHRLGVTDSGRIRISNETLGVN